MSGRGRSGNNRTDERTCEEVGGEGQVRSEWKAVIRGQKMYGNGGRER